MQPTYIITVRPEQQPDDPDGIRRLRELLKRLLRSFGMRCLSIKPEPQPANHSLTLREQLQRPN
jgi:hypothetical protein